MCNQKVNSRGYLALCQRGEVGEKELEGSRSSTVRSSKKTVHAGSVTVSKVEPTHISRPANCQVGQLSKKWVCTDDVLKSILDPDFLVKLSTH